MDNKEINLTGSIDMLKLSRAGIATIKGLKCLVIPIQENDIYITADENLKPKSAFIGINVIARREVSQYGKTHYIKQNLSKEYKDAYGPEVVSQKPYLGDMKPFVFENSNAANNVEAPSENVENEEDNLPF